METRPSCVHRYPLPRQLRSQACICFQHCERLPHVPYRPRRPRRRALILPSASIRGEEFHGSIVHLAGRSQETLRSIYLKALPGPLCWAPSYLVPVFTSLAVLGATRGHDLLHYLRGKQVPEWFPMGKVLQDVYSHTPGLWDIAFDSILSTVGALFIFMGLPAMDLILGTDPKTHNEVEGTGAAYKGILYSHTILHWLLLGSACAAVSDAHLNLITFLGLVLSLACSGSQQFTVTHELLHSPKKVDKTVASLGLMPLAYMHWVPSHIAHHCNVGKPNDPTTARFREPLYTYIPRSVLGNIQDGVRVECRRLNSRKLPLFSLHNRVLYWAAGPLGLLSVVYALWGLQSAELALGQAVFAIIMLEDVNYIEHYALQRKMMPSGKYERLSVFHSWNANWLFTNSITFSVQRHSDHHANAFKPYQMLEDVKDAPQLPASYPVMMLLALFPGLFFDVMDPRAIGVAQRRGQTLGK